MKAPTPRHVLAVLENGLTSLAITHDAAHRDPLTNPLGNPRDNPQEKALVPAKKTPSNPALQADESKQPADLYQFVRAAPDAPWTVEVRRNDPGNRIGGVLGYLEPPSALADAYNALANKYPQGEYWLMLRKREEAGFVGQCLVKLGFTHMSAKTEDKKPPPGVHVVTPPPAQPQADPFDMLDKVAGLFERFTKMNAPAAANAPVAGVPEGHVVMSREALDTQLELERLKARRGPTASDELMHLALIPAVNDIRDVVTTVTRAAILDRSDGKVDLNEERKNREHRDTKTREYVDKLRGEASDRTDDDEKKDDTPTIDVRPLIRLALRCAQRGRTHDEALELLADQLGTDDPLWAGAFFAKNQAAILSVAGEMGLMPELMKHKAWFDGLGEHLKAKVGEKSGGQADAASQPADAQAS